MHYATNRRPGSAAKFSDYHIWKALMCLDQFIPVGRKRLAEQLGLGEGSTRTLLALLEKYGCTFTNKTGIYLSEEGEKVRNGVIMEMAHLRIGSMTISDCDCAVKVPHASKRIKFGSEESDVALRNGARGATTLVYTDGVLRFPGTDQIVEESIQELFQRTFKLRDEDVIVIGTSNTPENAEMGAVSVALHLMGGLKFKKELHGILSSSSSTNELISLAFAIHELVGGLPVCAKSKNNLGIRIENGAVIDNAYSGAVLEEAIQTGKTYRKIAESGPYRGIRVIVTPIDLEGTVIGAVGVVDVKELFSSHLYDSYIYPLDKKN